MEIISSISLKLSYAMSLLSRLVCVDFGLTGAEFEVVGDQFLITGYSKYRNSAHSCPPVRAAKQGRQRAKVGQSAMARLCSEPGPTLPGAIRRSAWSHGTQQHRAANQG